ncbi:DnaA regulatory inactivator Hda [Roseobacter fucihabitans]|uniref:DnaA regulatory inactivator Hda n=1 Tax=Roseobacter fucihabitans TaxID=1537242 RepID=A0ABZ2BV52_9RHOB|nr:chromosomal replication initiator DnaA [Roseobacter litoralis]MBC6964815.1 DnaA regulatory inactivator Hda [Roseobacter litoralis]
MPEQLGFDLPRVAALRRADFLVAPSNAVALAMIEDPATDKLVLSGPDGSGKTHLAHIWAAQRDAKILPATALREDAVPNLAQGSVALEDVPLIAGDPEAQTALFHLYNLVLAEGHALLLTGRSVARDWGLTLPDLASRITAAPAVSVQVPDDALLAAVLAKLFADRQLTPKTDLIPYLIRRMDRSFAAAGAIVERLDAASLAQKRPLSRSFAATLLDKEDPGAR